MYTVVRRDEEDVGIAVGREESQEIGRSHRAGEVCDEGGVVVVELGVGKSDMAELGPEVVADDGFCGSSELIEDIEERRGSSATFREAGSFRSLFHGQEFFPPVLLIRAASCLP